MAFIRFDQSWASGLSELVALLQASSTPQPLADGATWATRSLDFTGLVRNKPEQLYSNCFEVKATPDRIQCFNSKEPLTAEQRNAFRWLWAFKEVGPDSFLSFHKPPPAVKQALGLTFTDSYEWKKVQTRDGLNSFYVAIELVRKSLTVKCCERGLLASPDSHLAYFPGGLLEKDRLNFRRPDGSPAWVQVTGERNVRRRGVSVPYRYHMSPVFYVRSDLADHLTALLKVRVYMTDGAGQPLAPRTAISRRKHLCKNWWNHEWLSRTLAAASFLADGKGEITVGSRTERLTVSATPMSWAIPVSIDESVLARSAWERGDILPGEDDDDEDQDEAAPATD
jgi:hypothetical protein